MRLFFSFYLCVFLEEVALPLHALTSAVRFRLTNVLLVSQTSPNLSSRSLCCPVLAGTVLAGTVHAGTVHAGTVLAGTVLTVPPPLSRFERLPDSRRVHVREHRASACPAAPPRVIDPPCSFPGPYLGLAEDGRSAGELAHGCAVREEPEPERHRLLYA